MHSDRVNDLVGLVRPFTVGNVAGPDLVFTAAIDSRTLRLPLLSADPAALDAVTRALSARSGHELPWQTFDVARHSDLLERALNARRADLTALRRNAGKSGAEAASRSAV